MTPNDNCLTDRSIEEGSLPISGNFKCGLNVTSGSGAAMLAWYGPAIHRLGQTVRPWQAGRVWLFLFVVSFLLRATHAAGGMLEIRDGYFWDPSTRNYFVPRGIAYQVWNPPVGANQSFEQLDYDLLEFKKIRANSVRCEMVWGELEVAEGDYDWSKPDYLVAQAEKLGLKLFVLIGFQYPPAWFPREFLGINAEGLTPKAMARLATATSTTAFEVFPARTITELHKAVPEQLRGTVAEALREGARSGQVTNVLRLLEARLPVDIATKVRRLMISDVINWEHPRARELYARHMAAVTGRYRNSAAIGAWIMGNEYAYFDLWEDPDIYAVHRFIGYDPYSQEAFRTFLRTLYQNNITALNANWGTAYADFSAVQMPEQYPLDRFDPGYHDLIQWRKRSIGDFVALGAVAARAVDPHHLQTYSMVGGIFSGRDANNTAEDAKTIVARCRAAGAPLDFWAINNYANAAIGSELRSADFGVGKYQAESGLPVMISETGHSSTENLFDKPDAGQRQPKALPGQLWESLVSGAIGTHLFHWSDRNQYSEKFFVRERGFGIVAQNRAIKSEVYTNVVKMFTRMEEIRIDRLLGASLNPPPDTQFFWSTNSDLVWPRANQENAMLWGSLKRFGFQPGIIDDAQFEAGAFTNAPVLLLSRAYQMNPAHLAALESRVLPAGIHLHANADLPGRFDVYHRPNEDWAARMSSIFGIDTSHASHSLHAIVTADFHSPIETRGVTTLAPITPAYRASLFTWNIWDNVGTSSGTTVLRHAGYTNGAPDSAALVVKNHSRAKTALNTFALGDSGAGSGIKEEGWDIRYDWLQAIYQTHFGVTPKIQLTGMNSKHVITDYRILRNGSLLISLLNEGTNRASVTLHAPVLITGKTVENLSAGGMVATPSKGAVMLELQGDDYVLLYAHDPATPSLLDSFGDRVWFESAPLVVHPRSEGYPVELGFDTPDGNVSLVLSLEQANGRPVRATAPAGVTGKGIRRLQIEIPDADLENPEYRSSADGGEYLLRAELWRTGVRTAFRTVPLRLAWPVRPLVPWPAAALPGRVYTAPLEWEDLPSPAPADPTPFDRARLWDRLNPSTHAYAITLNALSSSGTVVASDRIVTRLGSGTNDFVVAIPRTASGPFTWSADARPVTLQSRDVIESFEGHDRGARWPDDLTTDFIAPWQSFKYPPEELAGLDIWQNEGVQLQGSHGSQSAFLVITNPPGLKDGSFGLIYSFPEGPWALPEERSQWTNWSISFDFKEANLLPAEVEIQLKNQDPNGEGKWIRKSFPYSPGPSGWMNVRANVAELQAPEGMPGTFDPGAVNEFVLAIQMEREGAQYVGSFDHIRFDGPDTVSNVGAEVGWYLSANDSAGSLAIARAPFGQWLISWTGSGRLQFAEHLQGPWNDVPQAVNPLPVANSAPRRFYRLLR